MVEILNPDKRMVGQRKVAKKAAIEELWRRGQVRDILLDPNQLGLLAEFERSPSLKYVVLISRRVGKTFALVTLAVEYALRKPFQYIKYATTTGDAVFEMVMPAFNKILETCPEDVRPVYNVHRHKWIFPNGSEILLKGVDKDKGEGLRGQGADLAIVDEAGFVDCLAELVSDVFVPMVVEKEGRILLSSTPPRSSNHPFLSLIAEAERNRAITKRVLTDCPRFSKKQIETFIEETGGMESETCRRELFCEIIRDTSQAIVPEFTDAAAKAATYSEGATLDYLPDCYVSLDPGFVDNTAILFGYWDFPTATLVVQREYVGKGDSTEEIAHMVKITEEELWGRRQPFKRVSDTDLRLIKDLKSMHQLKFTKTEKDMKDMQINLLRIMVRKKQIKIHESCTNLISQLKYGQFKISASGNRDFKRTAELGHCDCIDSLLYLIRNINKTRNPIPEEGYNQYVQMDYFGDYSDKNSSNAKKLSKAFVRRR